MGSGIYPRLFWARLFAHPYWQAGGANGGAFGAEQTASPGHCRSGWVLAESLPGFGEGAIEALSTSLLARRTHEGQPPIVKALSP